MSKLRRCKGNVGMYVNGKWEKQEFSLGYFHTWGINYEEFENGPGHYTVGIVELPNGRIIMPAANNITFIDRFDTESDDEEYTEEKCCSTSRTYTDDDMCPYNEDNTDVQSCPHHLMGICSSDNLEEECPFEY